MKLQVLLLISLAATDILIGIQSLGVFWPVFALTALWLYRVRPHFSLDSKVYGKWLLLVFMVMAISAISSGASRLASLGYASMFFVYGFWLLASLNAFREADTAKAMKVVVLAYFGTAIAAKLVGITGVGGLETFLLTRQWTNENTGEMRPLGFSSEPSYAAFIVVLSWMTLIRLGCVRPGARNGFGLWTVLTLASLQMFGSIYGYLLGIIVALTALGLLPRAKRLRWTAAGVLLGLFIFPYIILGGDDARALRIFNAIVSGDLDTWLIEDTSSFFRFGPLFNYLAIAKISEPATWLGHGATSASYFFADLFRMHIDDSSDSIELGFLPAYIYDYGLVAGGLMLGFLYQTTRGSFRLAMVAILSLLVFNANFSTQMMWFAVTCGLVSRYSVVQSKK